MRKTDIIKEISQKTNIDKVYVGAIVEAFMYSVQDSIIRKESVSLRNFGNFILKKKGAKKARNILKNTEIFLPERYAPVFRPSKKFIDKVKKGIK